MTGVERTLVIIVLVEHEWLRAQHLDAGVLIHFMISSYQDCVRLIVKNVSRERQKLAKDRSYLNNWRACCFNAGQAIGNHFHEFEVISI